MKKIYLIWSFCFGLMFCNGRLVGQCEYSDFSKPLEICSKNSVLVNSLPGAGSIDDSYLLDENFSDQYTETNSFFIKWKVKTSGFLEFVLVPNYSEDDLDFILFNGNTHPSVVRSMARGQDLGELETYQDNCNGLTGLKSSSMETEGVTGCKSAPNNFLSPVFLEAGEEYVLMINNFHSTGGFLLEFYGDVEFEKVESCNELATTASIGDLNSLGLTIEPPRPNPTTGNVITKVTCDKSLEGRISLYTQSGKLLSTNPISLISGENHVPVSLENCITGIYIIKIQTEGLLQSFHVIKN